MRENKQILCRRIPNNLWSRSALKEVQHPPTPCLGVRAAHLRAQSCPTLCSPMDCSPPDSSVHGIFPGKNTGMGCHFLLRGIFPSPGIEPASNTLAGGFLTTAPPGKPAHSDFLPECTVWNGTESFIATWMNLESVIQSKASKKEKNKIY